jgi:hypothetical protein
LCGERWLVSGCRARRTLDARLFDRDLVEQSLFSVIESHDGGAPSVEDDVIHLGGVD